MATEEFHASISPEPAGTVGPPWEPDDRFGADLQFLGVVRGLENGAPIAGIEYSCYQPMAEAELRRLGAALLERYPFHQAWIHHQTGFVPAGQPSVVIRVRAPHSAEAYAISQHYLTKLKSRVPIWKTVRSHVPTGSLPA